MNLKETISLANGLEAATANCKYPFTPIPDVFLNPILFTSAFVNFHFDLPLVSLETSSAALQRNHRPYGLHSLTMAALDSEKRHFPVHGGWPLSAGHVRLQAENGCAVRQGPA